MSCFVEDLRKESAEEQTLDLSFQTHLDRQQITNRLDDFTSLRFVNVDGCSHFNDETLLAFSVRLPLLDSLSMRSCDAVTAFGLLPLLAKCTALTTLDISENENLFNRLPARIAGEDLLEMYREAIPKRLRSLVPLRFEEERKDTFAQAEHLCLEARGATFGMLSKRRMSSLRMQWMRIRDTDIEWLLSTPTARSSLLTLHLPGSEVTDASAERIAQRCVRLQDLDVSLSRIGAKGVEALSSLHRLNALDLSCLEGVQETSLLQVATKCTELKQLGLNRVEACTDGFLMHVTSTCKNLRELSLVSCTHVTQSAVEEILVNSMVDTLNFSGCLPVSSETRAIMSLVENERQKGKRIICLPAGPVDQHNSGLVHGWRPLPKSQQIKYMNRGTKKKAKKPAKAKAKK